jgi:hypothetical protein
MKKKMNCRDLRDGLTRGADARRNPAQQRHIEECGACRIYAARLRTARQLLRGHHGNIEPDADFSRRVIARLPRRSPTEVLGWAAVRFLPATVALTLVLIWFTLQTGAQPTTTETATLAPTEDLLSWIIDSSGAQP